jgi:hypothetical protein
VVSGRRLPCGQRGEVAQTYRMITESSRPLRMRAALFCSLGGTLLQKLVSLKRRWEKQNLGPIWVQIVPNTVQNRTTRRRIVLGDATR